MITLRDKDTGTRLGSISEEELQFLIDALEEESESDTDYYIDPDTIDLLEDEGAAANLVAMLRSAVEGKEGVDVSWSRD
jgi:hypothetical protein